MTMKPFNLAQAKIRERNRCRKEINFRLTVVASLICACLIIAAALFFFRLSITAKATRLRSALGDVQQRCVQIKQDMAEVKLSSAQRRWQKDLTGGSRQWLRLLGEVMGRLPRDAWIDRIENSPQNSSVTVEGGAASYETVSAYMSRLRRAPGTAEVRLSNSRVTAGGNKTFVEFALQIKLKALQAQPAPSPQPAERSS